MMRTARVFGERNRRSGKKELIGLIDGMRESAQSWKDLLLDLKRRGLAVAPKLAVADGALGFWQAIEEVWPQSRGQHWVHKTAHAQPRPATWLRSQLSRPTLDRLANDYAAA